MADKRSAEATQRLITILQVLADHPARGVEVGSLLAQLGSYAGTYDSQKDALSRDLKYLRNEGFVIDNVAGEGEDGRYVLQPGDDRVRLAFSSDQLFQLQRAAVLVGVDRLGALAHGRSPDGSPDAAIDGTDPLIDDIHVPEVLGDVQRAVRSRATVKFDYSGRRRTVHPYGLAMAPRGWVVEGWEEESGQAKMFSLQKMGEVRIDRPGTASPPERSTRPTLDPLRFALDDPAEAVLEVPTRFREQVDAVLHHPLRVDPGPESGGEPTQRLHYEVTNHTNFLVRVLRLDARVVLLGGDRMRSELRRMLDALAGVE